MRWWAVGPGPVIQTDVGTIPQPTVYIHALPSRKQRDLFVRCSDFEAVSSRNRFVRRIKRGLRNPDSQIALYHAAMGFPIQLWRERRLAY